MNTGEGPLSFDLLIRDVNFDAKLAAMERRIMGVASTAVRETSKIDQQFARLGQLAAGYFSFQALTDLPTQILKVRGEFQQLEIAFSTMLRSKSRQEKLLGELVQTAAATPFNLKDIASGAKQLLAYGSSASTVVQEIRMLGDVASGVSVPIGDLIYLYGTLRTQGRAYATDIRQFSGRGVPIYQELAKVLKVNVDQVNEFVTAGKVGFKEVEQAFKNMTSGSGLFAGLMDAQSKSLLGLKERLGDAWDLMLNEIGKKNQDIAGQLLNTTTQVVEHYQDVIDILIIAASTYGTYKAALLAVSTYERINLYLLQEATLQKALAAASGEVLSAAQVKQAVTARILQGAQDALNKAMLANPYVLVATAIAALVTAYFVFKEEVQEVKTAQELMAESAKGVGGQLRQQGSEIKALVSVIQNQNVAESERLKAYEKLKSIAPDIVSGLDFQRAKTADLTKEVNSYLVALQKKIRLESAQAGLKTALDQDIEATEALKKAQDALVQQAKQAPQNRTGTNAGPGLGGGTIGVQFESLTNAQKELERAVAAKAKAAQAVKDIEGSINTIYTGGSKNYLNAEIARLELVQTSIKDKLSPAYKQVEDDLAKLTAQRDALTKAEGAGGAAVVKTVEYYDTEIKKLKELQSTNATTRADFLKYQAQIDALDKQRRRLTGEMTKEEKKAAKDAEKVGPYGSLSYWESISKKADEVLSKTPSSNKGELARQNAIKLNADRKAEEIRKTLAVKSFDEELQDKRDKYELYQRWVTAYGQKSADEQFDTLLKSGQSYLAYLNSQINVLEAKKLANGKLTDQEVSNLSLANTQKDEIIGKKTAIDLFRDSLQKAGDEAANLTDYLDVLKQKQSELNPKDNSQSGIEIRRELAQEIAGTERDIKLQLAQYLSAVAGGEGQFLAIQKKFADLRTGVEKQFNGKRTADYKAALKQIDDDEKEALAVFQDDKLKQTEEYKKLTKVIDAEGRKRLKIEIANQQAVVDKAKELYGANSEIYKQQSQVLKGLTDQDKKGTIDYLNQYAAIARQFGDALSELDGGAGDAGRTLSALADQVGLVSQAFQSGLDDAQKYQIGIQGITSMITTLVSAAAQRKKADADYYQSVINQQQQYNLLLNEQIGLRSQDNQSIFFKDYEGQLTDGLAKYNDAQIKYEESLKKLQEGRAKAGVKGVFDNAAFLKLVGSGAATGAAIGSVVPVIGTAIGAVGGALVGAISGLFGGAKKKTEEFVGILSAYPALIQKSASGVETLNVQLAETLIAQNMVDESTKQLLQSTIDWQKQMEEAKAQIKEVVADLAGGLGDRLRDNLVGAFEDGTDAAQAFGTAVEDILEGVLSQMLFSKLLGPALKQLEGELNDSINGGDGNWTDDFGRFFNRAGELSDLYTQGLKEAQDAAKAYGFDLFTNPDKAATKDTPNSLSGGIKAVTEETASVLAGQINAIRITQADTNGVIRQQLLVMSGIERNTGVSNQWLESIDGKLTKLNNDPTRAKGL